ncbi:MAG TPA: YvcK family protein [Candidatus Portnoybacteria bacterium]|nr:YvcK family protein [Candidatus Portnoybacteria bacterium]
MRKSSKNIVTIGGGTGHFVLLSGLKKYPINLSAIVSMADNGGSTGRLRDSLGILPPGDIRQCLVALSNASESWRKLMNYRFKSGELKGHHFGNLLLSALEKTEGNFINGLNEASKILNIKGRVIPVSKDQMNLHLLLNNGETLVGEKQLDQNQKIKKIGLKSVFLDPKANAYQKALSTINQADMIVIGPGDHYGSIIPNLLVKGISEAIQSSHAKVVYICNLTNKKGQTDEFTVDDYVDSINNYLGQKRINFVIYNYRRPNKQLTGRYERKEGKNSIVKFNPKIRKKRNYKIVIANALERKRIISNQADAISETRSFIRHDSNKLAKILISILEIDNKNLIKKII